MRVVGPATLALSDHELVLVVGSLLWSVESEKGFDTLSLEEQVVEAIYVLEAEVNNGGFFQFFGNSSGDYASDTAAALEAVGALNAAALVRRALEPFGAAGPNPEQEVRQGQLEALGESAVDRWNLLDQEFYRYPDDLTALTAAYIRKHARSIRNVEPPRPDA